MSVWDSLADLLEPPMPEFDPWACDREECGGRPHEVWSNHGRTKQRIPEGDWFIWLLLCGRAWGKTRTGSECFLTMVLESPVDVEGRPTEWLVAGPTHDDTIKLLFEGVSSLSKALKARGIAYTYNKNEKLITLPTGQRIVLTNAEDEDLGRGGNWAGAWLDELGMYKRIKAAYYESLLPSIRALLPGGKRARLMITTTPKVARKDAWDVLQELTKTTDGSVVVTNGTTFENADNIPAETLDLWRRMYPEGSRLWRQELMAMLLDEVEGAFWSQELLDRLRVTEAPTLGRIVVAVDPSVTSTERSDCTGIVVAGTTRGGPRGEQQGFVLQDATAPQDATPDRWAEMAVGAYILHNADEIVYEKNQGGDLVRDTLRRACENARARGSLNHMPKITGVHASRGKRVRAEPIATLYEQGRVHHVGGFPDLELQLTTWTPDEKDSPDRLDALVWALTSLMGGPRKTLVSM